MDTISGATPQQLKYIEDNPDKFELLADCPTDENGEFVPLRLTSEEFARFKELCENSPPPSETAMKIARIHRQCTTKNPDGSFSVDGELMTRIGLSPAQTPGA